MDQKFRKEELFMKQFKRALALLLVVLTLVSSLALTANAYTPSDDIQNRIDKVISRHHFSVGWGVYDISGGTLKPVATYNADTSFQSNCTIKALMLYFLCTEMDAGRLSLSDRIQVYPKKLHYTDFPLTAGKYTVRFLIDRMIHVSNSSVYEVLLRYMTKEKFNDFLASIGSGTRVSSYTFMGYTTVNTRANDWIRIYNYCHSGAKNAGFAWRTFRTALLSPIRDGLARPVAHKCGWYANGTAADCAVVKTRNGGCYLMVIFTKNNQKGSYDLALIRQLARALDSLWNEYYLSLPPEERTKAKFD